MAQCIGRISSVRGILHFRDGKHRFYLAYRCMNKTDTDLCTRCMNRTADKLQSSGKFDHGIITGPIPTHSHLYRGDWYRAGCISWGTPSDEDIELAEQHYRATMQNEVKNEVK